MVIQWNKLTNKATQWTLTDKVNSWLKSWLVKELKCQRDDQMSRPTKSMQETLDYNWSKVSDQTK